MAAANGERLRGLQKAAIVLIALGPELAGPVIKNLSESDLEKLTLEVFRVEKVSDDTKSVVMKECREMAVARNFLTTGGADYARDLLEHALGKQKADEVLARLSSAARKQPFDFLREAEPQQIVNFLQGERPQTIALVLAHLSPNRAATILASLSPEQQSEVATRVALMERTAPQVVEQVENVLKAQLSKLLPTAGRSVAVGGVEFLAKTLTNADRGTEKVILDRLDATNPELALEVRKLLFVFDDIISLDNRTMQRILREVDMRDLVIALKGANEELRGHFRKNLSSRAAQTLDEELELTGPVRVRQVQEAQQRVVNVIRRLDESGEIVIQRGGGDVII